MMKGISGIQRGLWISSNIACVACCVSLLLSAVCQNETRGFASNDNMNLVHKNKTNSKTDQAFIQGDWCIASLGVNGYTIPLEVLTDFPTRKSRHPLFTLRFEGENWIVPGPLPQQRTKISTFSLDSAKSPKEIDFVRPVGTLKGIYALKENELLLCVEMGQKLKSRPENFLTNGSKTLVAMRYQKCNSIEPKVQPNLAAETVASKSSTVRDVVQRKELSGGAAKTDSIDHDNEMFFTKEQLNKLEELGDESLSEILDALQSERKSTLLLLKIYSNSNTVTSGFEMHRMAVKNL